MPDFTKINSALAYLREEIPAADISNNPVVKHPHNTSRTIPERLPPAKIKELSQLQPVRAVLATGGQWAVIATAIAVCANFWHPIVYVLAVLVIGARQHALLVLGHDAAHFRTLRVRWQNDLFANVFLMWPTFASVEGFRKFHGTHHQTQAFPTTGTATFGTRTMPRASSPPIGSFPKPAWDSRGCCCAARPSTLGCFGSCAA